MKKVKLDILGSCISRVMLLSGNTGRGGVDDERMELQYFFDKNNIVSSMMPAPFSREEVEGISADELYDKGRIRVLKQGITKDTVPMILAGDAEYLIIDVYDLSVSVSCYKNTTFSNCSYEFYRTNLYKKYADDIGNFNFMDIPSFLWYPYIDLFFEKIAAKFDNDHIILNRFHACENYIDKDGTIKVIPEAYLKPFHAHFKYNDKVRELEDYIIKKINPYVIDLSKYFIVDGKHWNNINGVHYQKLFYEESLRALQDILFNEKSVRVYDKVSRMVAAEILNKEMADDMEYLNYLKEIKSPLSADYVLNMICSVFTDKVIVQNRRLLAKLYKIADEFKDELRDKNFKEENYIKFLIEKLPKEDSEIYEALINFMLNFYKEDKSEAVNYLEGIFLNMINDGDMDWVDFLEKVEKYAPNDKKVLAYRLQYFQAVNDIDKINEYKNKIESLAVTL